MITVLTILLVLLLIVLLGIVLTILAGGAAFLVSFGDIIILAIIIYLIAKYFIRKREKN